MAVGDANGVAKDVKTTGASDGEDADGLDDFRYGRRRVVGRKSRRPSLRQDVFDDVAVDIGEAKAAALVFVGQAFVVDT